MAFATDLPPAAIKRIAGTGLIAVTGLGLLLGIGVAWIVLDTRSSVTGTGRYLSLDSTPVMPAPQPPQALIDRQTGERLIARLGAVGPVDHRAAGDLAMAGRTAPPLPAWSAPTVRPPTQGPANHRPVTVIGHPVIAAAPAWSVEAPRAAPAAAPIHRPVTGGTADPVRVPAPWTGVLANPGPTAAIAAHRPMASLDEPGIDAPPPWAAPPRMVPVSLAHRPVVGIDRPAIDTPPPWASPVAVAETVSPDAPGRPVAVPPDRLPHRPPAWMVAAIEEASAEQPAPTTDLTPDLTADTAAIMAAAADLNLLGLDGLPSGTAAEEPSGLIPPIDKESLDILTVTEVDELAGMFAEAGFSYLAARDGDVPVPRLLIASFPQGIEEVQQVDERKSLFFNAVLPIILQVNEAIAVERARLMEIQLRLSQGLILTPEEEAWLAEIATEYEADPGDIDTLLTRVDTIPPSMALSQGAVESGWGTSRLAREGNALFGQITTSDSELVNADGVRFAAFETIYDSVAAYARNLNTHPAYAEFRAERAELREQRAVLDGYALIGTLHAYSELGEEYIAYVRRVMRANGLQALDDARLEPRFTLEASL